MLVVESTGPSALLQDLGRPGLATLGVTRSGAFDLPAAALANRLVGNPESACVIEALSGGLILRADGPTVVAVTGASAEATLDGRRVAGNTALTMRSDSLLELPAPRAGVRSYVAVRGGIAVPAVLGSRSYDTLGRIGPEPLEIGDWLPIGPATLPAPPIDHAPMAMSTGEPVLDVTAGPRHDWFSADGWDVLVSATWRVQPTSDRVGIRLSGPVLPRTKDRTGAELPPEGLVQGAIQVPPDGQPIIMGPDHPTTGGYPVIAVLAPPDRSRCAQLVPGESVRLRAILVPGR